MIIVVTILFEVIDKSKTESYNEYKCIDQLVVRDLAGWGVRDLQSMVR